MGAGVILLLVGMVIAVLVTTFAPRGGVRDLDTVPTASRSAAPTVGGGSRTGPGSTTSETVLLVHVLGAVTRPGIVELRQGARVVDAIASAGGLAADANPAGVNLARPVSDGEQLVVPREGEELVPAAGPSASVGGGSGGSLVSLNRASVTELQALPRIGPALAQRIVDWRESNGPFSVPADLMKVSGIGQTLFDALKDLITL